eukprot:360342-Chlamydomonas_euryale.AAC.3
MKAAEVEYVQMQSRVCVTEVQQTPTDPNRPQQIPTDPNRPQQIPTDPNRPQQTTADPDSPYPLAQTPPLSRQRARRMLQARQV